MDLTRGVAVRLSAFCLAGRSGRLRTDDLWDHPQVAHRQNLRQSGAADGGAVPYY